MSGSAHERLEKSAHEREPLMSSISNDGTLVDMIIAMILVQFVVVGVAMCEESTVRLDDST
jgi:hypothetical protein